MPADSRAPEPRPLCGAVEAGGTKFVCAVGYGPREILEHCLIATTAPEATLSAVRAFFERVRREREPPASIGIATFGPVDLDARSSSWGTILSTPKAGWTGVSLAAPLAERFKCPVVLDTDVNAAALAESLYGAGCGTRSLAYVTVGTGIGGGVAIEGRTIRGMLHPEMGHIRVSRHPADTEFAGTCPFHGDCLEGLASGPAIVARWRTTADRLPDAHPAREILGWYLGQLAATIALVCSCERIVFGGGVMSDGRLLPFIRRAASQQLAGYLPIEARGAGFDRYITSPALGNHAGLAGAMALALEAVRSADDGSAR
jgi:fructokinase